MIDYLIKQLKNKFSYIEVEKINNDKTTSIGIRINGNNEVKLVLEDYKSVCTNTMSSNYYIPVNGRTSANFGYSTNNMLISFFLSK